MLIDRDTHGCSIRRQNEPSGQRSRLHRRPVVPCRPRASLLHLAERAPAAAGCALSELVRSEHVLGRRAGCRNAWRRGILRIEFMAACSSALQGHWGFGRDHLAE